MGNRIWIISTKRMALGLIVCVIVAVSGFIFELISGIDISFVKFVMPSPAVLVFSLIALRKPEEKITPMQH